VNICAGSTMDNQIVRELFTNTIAAAELLGKDNDLIQELKGKRDKLAPNRIGQYGQIMEWMEDYKETDVHHRHTSQLYGLHPGNELTYEKTPELMKAARTTLERRGDESTGWSMAWKINFWARLKDGNHAFKLIRDLFTPVSEKNGNRGTYPNLFSSCPPLQIDANFGGSAGIAEMLLQSHSGYIELLPALPDAWSKGSVSGICARGGFVISMNWADKTLKTVSVLAKNSGKATLVSGGKRKEITLKKGQKITLEW